MRRFPFEFDDRFRPMLRLFGASPGHAEVRVTDTGRLAGRFGLWSFDTTVENVAGTQLGGDYRWYKVLGVRGSLSDRGATFGSNTRAGLCIRFHHAIPILYGTLVPNTAVTVTVADPTALTEALHSPGH